MVPRLGLSRRGHVGPLVGKRPGFQRMLKDLRSGRVKADLILVDTFERFGRAEEIASIRQKLEARHKILVLTADSNFTDPTSPAGRALAAIEASGRPRMGGSRRTTCSAASATWRCGGGGRAARSRSACSSGASWSSGTAARRSTAIA